MTDTHSDKYFRYFGTSSFCIVIVGTLPNVNYKSYGTFETHSSHHQVSKCTLYPTTDMGLLMLLTCHSELLLGFEGEVQQLCFGPTFVIVSALLQIGRGGVESSKCIWFRLLQLSSKFNFKLSSPPHSIVVIYAPICKLKIYTR